MREYIAKIALLNYVQGVRVNLTYFRHYAMGSICQNQA